ncbi:MAG: response regulator [Spirochaetales bacterium]
MAKHEKKIRIFSALEVANICGVVNQTAINWIKNGYLKAFTTPGGQYRVYAEDLVEFLSSRNMRMPEELLAAAEGVAEKRKILIVDDDQSLNNMLKEYLSKKFPDFPIFQAFDGFEAGRVMAEQKPALVVLDIDLPGINGKELCKRIKNDASLGVPKVLVVTGLEDKGLETTMKKEGADAFLKKPLDFDELTGQIFDLLKQARV